MSKASPTFVIRRILVALDASPHSLAALEAAVDLAAMPNSWGFLSKILRSCVSLRSPVRARSSISQLRKSRSLAKVWSSGSEPCPNKPGGHCNPLRSMPKLRGPSELRAAMSHRRF